MATKRSTARPTKKATKKPTPAAPARKDYTPQDVIDGNAPHAIMLRYAALALLDPGPDAFIATGPNDPRLPQPLVAAAPAQTPATVPALSTAATTPVPAATLRDTPLTLGFEQLTWTLKQTCSALQVSRGFLYKLELAGTLLPLPDGRHKRYSIEAVKVYASRTADSVASEGPKEHRPHLRLVAKSAS